MPRNQEEYGRYLSVKSLAASMSVAVFGLAYRGVGDPRSQALGALQDGFSRVSSTLDLGASSSRRSQDGPQYTILPLLGAPNEGPLFLERAISGCGSQGKLSLPGGCCRGASKPMPQLVGTM